MGSVRHNPSAQFAVATLLAVAACIVVVRSHAFTLNPDLAAWGVTFDLTISVPLLYWFCVVRTGRASPLTIAPVLLVGTLIATALIPRAQQQFVQQIRSVILPIAELLLGGALALRLWKVRKERHPSSDPYEWIHACARSVAGLDD